MNANEIVTNQITTLLEEREKIAKEMSELKQLFDSRQNRLIEIAGSIQSLQEVLNKLETTNDTELPKE